MTKIVYSPSSLKGLEILSCSDGSHFAKHLHDGYVLWLNSESGEHYAVRGNSDILETGAISLIEPDVVHSNHPFDPEKRHLRSFYFSEEFLRKIHSKISEQDRAPAPLRTNRFQDQQLWRRLAVLHEKLLRGGETMQLEEEIISTFALFAERCAESTPVYASAALDGRITEITDYLHAHLDTSVSLSELAALADCTEFHLIRLFKQHKGMSPHAFHMQLRLEKARRMLEQGQPIADAAMQSGLSDQSHLTRAFKQRYGITPGQYQKQRKLK